MPTPIHSRWARKPPSSRLTLNRDHHSHGSLRVAIAFTEFGGEVINLVTGQQYSLGAGQVFSTVDGEEVLDFSASTEVISLGNIAPEVSVPPFTVITRGGFPGIGSSSTIISYSNDAALNTGWALKSEQYNTTGKIGFTKSGVVDITSGFATPGYGTHSVSCIAHASNEITVFNDDGYELLADTSAFSSADANDIQIAGVKLTASLMLGDLSLILIYADDIGVDAVFDIQNNPWQVFAPRKIWIPTALSGGITGTGTLSAATATLTGTGIREVVGSAAMSANTATSSGAGTIGRSGTGALSAETAVIIGSGTVGAAITGTGTLTSSIASITGTGIRTITGTSTLQASTSLVAGTGSRIITGSGTLISSSAAIAGTGVRSILGSGTLTSTVATISGTGATPINGIGVLTASDASISGLGERAVTGSGGLVASTAIIKSPIQEGSGGMLSSLNVRRAMRRFRSRGRR